jgi:uncharacterized protein YbjQ (UPF0145 family)
MKRFYFVGIVLSTILIGCHGAEVTRYNNSSYYPSTSHVDIFSDVSTIKKEYFEIGYVEAKGGVTVGKQQLLDDMIEQAKIEGANALIKVEFYDRERYDKYVGGYSKPAARATMIRYK